MTLNSSLDRWHRNQDELSQQRHAVRDHRFHRHQTSPPYEDRISNNRLQRHRSRDSSSASEEARSRYPYARDKERYYEGRFEQGSSSTSGYSKTSSQRSRWDSERHTGRQERDYSSSHAAGSAMRFRSPDGELLRRSDLTFHRQRLYQSSFNIFRLKGTSVFERL
jgi:hypothetical protein